MCAAPNPLPLPPHGWLTWRIRRRRAAAGPDAGVLVELMVLGQLWGQTVRA